MDRTLVLIGRAHQGDKAARDLLFEENTGLIYSVAKRFLGRGVEMEDLFQIGSIGLLKAVDKFDMSYDDEIFHLCRSMIIGEIQTLSQGRRDTEGKPFSEGKPLQDLSGERSTDTPAGAGTYDGRNGRGNGNFHRRTGNDHGIRCRGGISSQNDLSG